MLDQLLLQHMATGGIHVFIAAVQVSRRCSGAVCGQVSYVYCEVDTLITYHVDKGDVLLAATASRLYPHIILT